MTVFHYRTPRIPLGRDYMLEVNPHYTARDGSGGLNVIDARWIDTESGLFIDITAVRKNRVSSDGPDVLSCKDGHKYKESQLFPLRDTFFEGQPCKIPFAYAKILEEEYGGKSMTNGDYAELVLHTPTRLQIISVSTNTTLQPRLRRNKTRMDSQNPRTSQGRQRQG